MNLFCRPRPLPGKGLPATGDLTVTISPAGAVTAGAQWSVDGGATWNDSGDTLALAPATYTVSFKAVAGWDTPADVPVTVTAGGAETEAGTYTEVPAAIFTWDASDGLTADAGGTAVGGVWNGFNGMQNFFGGDGLITNHEIAAAVFEFGKLRIVPDWQPAHENSYQEIYGASQVESADCPGLACFGALADSGAALHTLVGANPFAMGDYAAATVGVASRDFDMASVGFVWITGGGSPVAAPLVPVDTITGAAGSPYDALGGAGEIAHVSTVEVGAGYWKVCIVSPKPAGAAAAILALGANNSSGQIFWDADGSTVSADYGFATGFGLAWCPPVQLGTTGITADEVTWQTPASVQAALASEGAAQVRLTFGAGAGDLPDGVIMTTDRTGGNNLFFMASGNLSATDGTNTATVAFAPTYASEYDLRAEWGPSGLRVGYKAAADESFTYGDYASFSGSMPDDGEVATGFDGMDWLLYFDSFHFEG